jgi:hypothetical protein
MPVNPITTILPNLESNSSFRLTMRYKEPFVTEGLNKKFAVNTPRGTYRGWRLQADSSTALSIDLVADPVFQDHSAVVEVATGYSVNVYATGGNIGPIDVSALAASPGIYIIVLSATYALGVTTHGEVDAYTQTQWQSMSYAQQQALCPLGTVNVPASGIIPPGNVYHDQRLESWMAEGPENAPWTPVLQNGSFDRAPTEAAIQTPAEPYAVAGWQLAVTSGNGNWAISATDFNPNGLSPVPAPNNAFVGNKSLEFDFGTSPAETATATQYVGVPAATGQLVKILLWLRTLQTPTAGTLNLVLSFSDEIGALSTTYTQPVQASLYATPGSWVPYSVIVTVPAAGGANGLTTLTSVQIQVSGMTFGSPAAALRFDDMQVWVETNGPQTANLTRESRLSGLAPSVITWQDIAAANLSDLNSSTAAGVFFFDSTSGSAPAGGQLVFQRRDGASGSVQPYLNVKGRLTLGQNLVNTQANAQIARIELPAAAELSSDPTLTLMFETPYSSATNQGGARYYVDNLGGIYLCFNCFFTNGNASPWSADNTTQESMMLLLGQQSGTTNSAVLYTVGPTASSWLFQTVGAGGWTYSNVLASDSGIGATSATETQALIAQALTRGDGTAPSAGAGTLNIGTKADDTTINIGGVSTSTVQIGNYPTAAGTSNFYLGPRSAGTSTKNAGVYVGEGSGGFANGEVVYIGAENYATVYYNGAEASIFGDPFPVQEGPGTAVGFPPFFSGSGALFINVSEFYIASAISHLVDDTDGQASYGVATVLNLSQSLTVWQDIFGTGVQTIAAQATVTDAGGNINVVFLIPIKFYNGNLSSVTPTIKINYNGPGGGSAVETFTPSVAGTSYYHDVVPIVCEKTGVAITVTVQVTTGSAGACEMAAAIIAL